ncbi:SHOCT domain-containing protein [Kitasatospora sp. NPDC049285]|uniref:SHOCT domain-containing protein n=1 Tax=Kitasatospora sp. NPDC049285 TaxID=3157096 RepID=UPI00343590AE
MRHYWHHGPNGGWEWMFPGLAFLLLLLLIAGVALLLWRTQAHRTAPPPAPHWGGPEAPLPAPEAERLLAERLARGEIEVDEYRERLAALREGTRGNGPPGTS